MGKGKILRPVCWSALRGMLVSVAFIVAACGGSGDGGSTPPPSTTPPSNLSYGTPPVFVLNEPIAALKPSVTGTVTSYRVSPALPSGLSIDGSTGVISGTPTSVTPKASYTVTAGNAGGSTTATVSMVVNSEGAAPAMRYASAYYSFTVGVAAQPIKPTLSGGTAVSWSVQPALPAGLSLSSTDGSISGTPTAGAAAAQYVVSALGTGATTTATLTLAVVSAPLVDLGHAASIVVERLSSSRLFTQDDTGHWVLWNYSTGQNVVNGNASVYSTLYGYMANPVDMQGSTIVLQTGSGLEVRDASDGHVLAEITAKPTWWKLASDGSYVCAGNGTQLIAWNTAGSILFQLTGNFAGAVAYAAPTQVQVALGPQGSNVIQTFAVPAGTSTVSPTFQGQFQSWFGDGSRFLSEVSSGVGGTVWVYSNAAVQQDIAQLPTTLGLGGTGNWYWTVNSDNGQGTTALYQVGSGSQAFATYSPGISSTAISSGGTLALFSIDPIPQITVIDLANTGATAVAYATAATQYLSAYAATSATNWVIGTTGGVLIQGAVNPARYFGYGAPVSIAGSTSNAAIATASGQILLFNATTGALQGTIPQPAGEIALSGDGTVLAAELQINSSYYDLNEESVTVYSLPSDNILLSFTYAVGSPPAVTGVTLSQSGTILGQLFESASPCLVSLTSVTTGGTSLCDTAGSSGVTQIALSPDGTLLATSTAIPNNVNINSAPATNIYLNGTLSTAISGWAVGWIDNSSLLVETYAAGNEGIVGPTGMDIYSSSGTLQSKTTLPDLNSIQPVPTSSGGTPTSIYSSTFNAIYSLANSAVIWSSGSPEDYRAGGAVSGSNVVFASGNLILAEPYP
jgi:putative Ig domain-containing protein